MTRPSLLALTLTLTGLASACVGLNFGGEEGCAEACEYASFCGFLPSAFGSGATEAEAIADCERLCHSSPRDKRTTDLLECMTIGDDDPQTSEWCDDATHDTYLEAKICGDSSSCLEKKLPGNRLLGAVDLEVALISIVDFEYIFGDGAVAGLYKGSSDGALHSCNVGLCGPKRCTQYADDVKSACDPVMCGLESFPIRKACNDLSVLAIDLVVEQTGRVRSARQTLLDEASATTCKESSLVFDSAAYNLKPGPLRASARVTGNLPAGDLKRIGYAVNPAVADDALTEYCLEFAGMDMLGRAGEGLVLVPFGDIDQILDYLTSHGVTIPPCDR